MPAGVRATGGCLAPGARTDSLARDPPCRDFAAAELSGGAAVARLSAVCIIRGMICSGKLSGPKPGLPAMPAGQAHWGG